MQKLLNPSGALRAPSPVISKTFASKLPSPCEPIARSMTSKSNFGKMKVQPRRKSFSRFTQSLLLATIVTLFSTTSSGKTIAFFYALEADERTFRDAAGPSIRQIKIGNAVVSQYSLKGHTIYSARMRSGCVATAASAQALLSRFSCDDIISVGPVGALDPTLEVGSWHRVTRVVAWQKGSWMQERLIRSEQAEWNFAVNELSPVPDQWKNISTISVSSGEAFVASDSFRTTLRAETGCDAVDMNLFGLLLVVQSHGLTGKHFRIVSDRADAQASEDFEAFVRGYDGTGGKLVAEMIELLPPDKTSPEAYEELRQLIPSGRSESAGKDRSPPAIQ